MGGVRRFLAILARAVGGLLLASVLIFAAVQAMPEDPVNLLQKLPDPATTERLRAQLGLDEPLPQQCLRFLADFVTLDWGASLLTGRSVADEVATFLPATIELAGLALLLGAVLGFFLILGAEALGFSGAPGIGRGLGAIGLTVPIFWIGLFLLLLFSLWVPWFPSAGRFDYAETVPEGPTGLLVFDSLLAGDLAALGTSLQHLALPVATLSLYPAALVSGTLAARLQDPNVVHLIQALRAKGLSPVRIWGLHILRLVSPPAIAVIGTNAGALIGGAVLTETVFAWPGMGRYLVQAVLNRDLFVIQHGLLLTVVLALLIVALADALARAVSPTLARGERSHETA